MIRVEEYYTQLKCTSGWMAFDKNFTNSLHFTLINFAYIAFEVFLSWVWSVWTSICVRLMKMSVILDLEA